MVPDCMPLKTASRRKPPHASQRGTACIQQLHVCCSCCCFTPAASQPVPGNSDVVRFAHCAQCDCLVDSSWQHVHPCIAPAYTLRPAHSPGRHLERCLWAACISALQLPAPSSAGSYLIGIDANGLLMFAPSNFAPFYPVYTGHRVPVQRVRVFSDGTLYGVGRDGNIYTRASLHNDWVQVPGYTCCMTDVAQMPDGSVVGLGTRTFGLADLYTRTSLQSVPWLKSELSCCITSITVLRSGTIVGIDSTSHLVSKAGPHTAWIRLGDGLNCCVKDFTQLPDGTFVGISHTNQLVHKRTLAESWSLVTTGVTAVTHSLPTGEI
jgi:hypothetical protein